MKDIRALIIRPDGIEEKTISQDLETLQSLVGGYVETIKLGKDAIGLVNEEGKMLKLPLNHVATLLCDLLEIGWHEDDTILGTMVVVAQVDQEGHFRSLSREFIDKFKRVNTVFGELTE